MLPMQSGFAKLFQPWQPQVIEEPAQLDQCQFIELPPVSSYQQLLNAPDFPAIQSQFLGEIVELKQLAHQYVNHHYDRALDVFRAKITCTGLSIPDDRLPIYRETRFQIHQLILLLRRHRQDHLPATAEARPKMACDDYITSVLHDCLDGIDLCLSGVHSRFSTAVPNLEAARATELDGKLYKVRNDLFCRFVQSFILQLRREGCRVLTIMEIHWFNGLYNLYCENLALPLIVDSLANHYLTDENLARYLSAAPLSVCAFTIMQTLVSDWSEQMAAALASVGCSHWLTGPVRSDENTTAGVNILNNQVFRPINNMTGSSNPLNFMAVMDSVGDDSFHLKRHREKMFAWACKHLFAGNTTVFATVNGGASDMYIGTIGHIYFWVFHSSQRLHTGQVWVLPPELDLSVQLPHLQTIDFSTWPETTALALLTQALEQTTDGRDVAAFFLNPEVASQLAMLPEFIRQSLSAQLSEKLLSAGGSFQQALCHQLCHYFAGCTNLSLSTKPLDWLMDTLLLQPVLYVLKQRGIDIAQLTAHLNCWQISTFTSQQMRELLTPEDCLRLFRDALAHEQVDNLCHLLFTEHCDSLIERRSNELRLTPLALFARRGKLAGVQYLLSRLIPALEARDIKGYTPLQSAVQNGHTLIVRALLAVPGLSVNATDSRGWSALHHATAEGRTDCVRELLRSTWIDINLRTGEGETPLNLAAQTGHLDCLLELLQAPGIDVNLPACNSCTPLHNACYFRHMPCFTALLATPGIAINKCNHLGTTVLNIAARMGLSDMLQAVLRVTGVDVNLSDHLGRTPLHSAVENRNVECIRLLMAVPGIDLNALTGRGMSPLNVAAASGYSDGIRELLKSSGVQVNSVNCNGWTLLQRAIERGHWECVWELLRVPGIQIKTQAQDGSLSVAQAVRGSWLECPLSLQKGGIAINDKFQGMSSLNHVARSGCADMLRELLKMSGIDVNSIDNNGKTPLHAAVDGNSLECVKALLGVPDIEVNQAIHTDGRTALCLAASSGFYGCTRALLRAENIQVNQTAHNGQTALHFAARCGQTECLKALLLAPGIDVNKRDINGFTPLHLAADNGQLSCVEALLRVTRVNVNVANNCAITPLHSAVLSNQLGCVRLLLSAPGIDINQMTSRGVTALSFAIGCDSLECVRELLRVTGVQVNLASCHSMPPLLKAAFCGRPEFIRALLAVPGIKVNKRSIAGNTALNIAADKGHLECLRELLKAPDIDVNLGANNGSTPLHSAASKGYLTCVLALIVTSGVDLKKKNLIGKTPLDLARQNRHYGCYKLIANQLYRLPPWLQ